MLVEILNIQHSTNEERQQLQKYRSQDLWPKAILPSLDNLERAVEGLTDDVKKEAWKWSKKVWYML